MQLNVKFAIIDTKNSYFKDQRYFKAIKKDVKDTAILDLITKILH